MQPVKTIPSTVKHNTPLMLLIIFLLPSEGTSQMRACTRLTTDGNYRARGANFQLLGDLCRGNSGKTLFKIRSLCREKTREPYVKTSRTLSASFLHRWPAILCMGSQIVNVLPSTVSLAESCSSCPQVFHEQQRQLHNLQHHHSPSDTTFSPLGPCAFE